MYACIMRHACMHVCIYVRIYVCMCVCVRVCIYVCACACVSIACTYLRPPASFSAPPDAQSETPRDRRQQEDCRQAPPSGTAANYFPIHRHPATVCCRPRVHTGKRPSAAGFERACRRVQQVPRERARQAPFGSSGAVHLLSFPSSSSSTSSSSVRLCEGTVRHRELGCVCVCVGVGVRPWRRRRPPASSGVA